MSVSSASPVWSSPAMLAALMGLLMGGMVPGGATWADVFEPPASVGARPWNSEAFDAAEEKFTFAVFSDLTGGEREGVFEVAVAQLNLLRPEFIINVGDLIEGETRDRAELERQWDSFDRRAGQARAPVFYVGGNHDLAGDVMQEVWDERYGRRYYHFLYRDVLFLVLDTEDHTPERTLAIQSARDAALERVRQEGWGALPDTTYASLPEYAAGAVGREQAEYFRGVIAKYRDVRWTFLFLHKAPWERPEERHFAAIEAALADRPYTVFHGHVHGYAHQQRQGRDYIRLATTGGVQLPGRGRSLDHVTLVTVDGQGVDIANLLMSGILDKTGRIPLDGDELCFEVALCVKD
jgi:predicted phosphodiesterase